MIKRKIFHIAIITLCLYFLLFSFITAAVNPSVSPQDSTEIVFTKSSQTLGNTRSFGLAIADVDLDDDNDIFFANYISSSRLWLNDGNGNFTMQSQIFGSAASSTHVVDIADLNGDLYPDIFLVNHDEPSKVYFNNGNGSYTESGQIIGTVGEYPQTIQLTDVDGDSDYDAYIYNLSAPNRIWLNDGDGFFTMRNIDYGGNNSNRQILADLNDDSFPDLYISYRTQDAQIWMNDGAGNFINTGQALGYDNDIIDFADVDGDDDIDILEANSNGMSIWLNQNNTGTFTAGFTFNEGAVKCKFISADLDGDPDLVTTHLDNGNKLWLNDGNGSYSLFGTVFGSARILSIGCEDLDDDNDIDVVFGQLEGTGGNSIYFNESTILGVEEKNSLELIDYKLNNNYPNPFNPSTTISYSIPIKSFISLKIYDVLGNEITALVNEEKLAGKYEVEFNAIELTSGIYFYKLIAGKFIETKKMVILK